MNIQNLKRGDIIICIKTYVETEFGYGYYSNQKYSKDGRLVHLKQGKKYKVENINNTQIEVLNDFGKNLWYEIDRFDTIKEMRRRKLLKLKKSK